MPLWSKNSKRKQAEPPKAAKVSEKAPAKPPAEAEAKKELSTQEVQKRREVSRRLLMRFGEVVSVLMRAPQFRDLPLKHLQDLVVPPLTSGQFLVAEAQSKAQGFLTPGGGGAMGEGVKGCGPAPFAEFGQATTTLTQGVEQRRHRLADRPGRKSASARPLAKAAARNDLSRPPVKMRSKSKDGKTVITTLTGAPKGAN